MTSDREPILALVVSLLSSSSTAICAVGPRREAVSQPARAAHSAMAPRGATRDVLVREIHVPEVLVPEVLVEIILVSVKLFGTGRLPPHRRGSNASDPARRSPTSIY